jgi:hypothetical protein
MRTTTGLSRRQVGAKRRAGTFLGVSRAFVYSGLPERVPGGRGWHGLAGWMKAQIRAKTRNRGRDWAVFRHPNEKKRLSGASWGRWLEMLLWTPSFFNRKGGCPPALLKSIRKISSSIYTSWPYMSLCSIYIYYICSFSFGLFFLI